MFNVGAVASADGSALAKIGYTVSAFSPFISLSLSQIHTYTHHSHLHIWPVSYADGLYMQTELLAMVLRQ